MKPKKTHRKTSNLSSACLLLAGLSFLFVGCPSLNFPNPNAPILEDIPIQSLATGIEAGMRTDYAIYLRVVSVVGREAYYFEPADPRYTGELLFGIPDPGGFLLNRPWRGRYQVVRNCNFLLEKSNSELSGSQKSGTDGFAKTIMAYQLLLNLNYLDDNGIQLDFSGTLKPFASKSESFAFIENLLDEAYSDLGQGGAAFPFQLSGGFTGFDTPSEFAKFNKALRARVAAYQAKWDDVLGALGDSFLDPSGALDMGVYHAYGTGLGDQLNDIFEPPTADFIQLMAHKSFETDAETGDDRFATKVLKRSSSTTFDNLTTDLAVTVTRTSTDPLPIIRNEELILLRAEANIGLGFLANAQDDINIVRTAAGLPDIDINSPPQGTALDQLLYERRYSLFLEGHRWVDMRRYGKLGELPIDRPSTDVVLDKMPRPESE